ncbi:hypothetical protein ACFFLS_06045 [Flavobacterium procerum]|uniref:Uncharacterized protein n=1 Tax=Flavobacterium procerum TaxID=1455569 RepID=A0ABV6BMC8_9FLAO
MVKKQPCTTCKQQPADHNEMSIKMLVNIFPFLKNVYRELKETELESEEVFKELFSDNDIVDFGLLKAVYKFQQLKNISK